MKHALLLSALSIVLLSSCTTAFKAGQTPDDVYYSPGADRPAKEERVSLSRNQEAEEYFTYLDDRYLRMKVANRYRWGALDNFDYWNDSRYDFNSYNSYSYYNATNPYAWNHGWNLGLGYGYRSWNPYYNSWGWNSPFYTVVAYSTPSFGTTSGSNISAYRNKSYNNSNYGYKDPKTGAFIPSGNNNGFGSLLKKVFTTGTDNTQSYDRPVRTYQPSTTTPSTPPATSSSAGGSSGGYGSTGSSSSSGRGGRGN